MKSDRMKKWMAGTIFSLLGIVVIGFSIKLSYDVMAILFPNDPVLKFMAIALFDGGVIGWLLAYVAKAKGTPQRGVSLLMTVLDFLGVATMAIGGIYLSGQTLADIPKWVGDTVVVVTIIATVLNAGAYYYYHANDPATREEIQAQELEDDLNEEAMDQARFQVERKAQELGAIMANRVTARMKYRLRLPMTEQEVSEWKGEVIDAPAYDVNTLPPPPVQEPTFWDHLKSFFGGKQSRRSSAMQPLKNSTVSQVTAEEIEELAATSDSLMCWEEMPDGRKRYWCKICRDEGNDWLTPEACEHVQTATAGPQIKRETAMEILKALRSEESAKTE